MCTSPLPARRVGGQIEFLGRAEKARFFSNKTATLQIPCGRCTECRLKYSREWAIRCVHEASLYKENCSLTLTYDDDHVSSSLIYRDFQLFMKRLIDYERRACMREYGKDWKKYRQFIRFYVGGEYGETNPLTGCIDGGLYRPHYHAILFNYNFPDRKPLRLLSGDYEKSALADRLWGNGNVVLGEVNFESAAYIARYCMKKMFGARAMWHYMCVSDAGEIVWREPEFSHCSKGIGAGWIERYHSEVYRGDFVIARGNETHPPRYYDKYMKAVFPDRFEELMAARIQDGRTRAADHTDARNNVRAVVVDAGVKTSKRT